MDQLNLQLITIMIFQQVSYSSLNPKLKKRRQNEQKLYHHKLGIKIVRCT